MVTSFHLLLSALACTPDVGVSAHGDCDDDEATVHPDAYEVCDDGVDNDCDGLAEGCELVGDHDPFDADAVLYGEGSGDHAGTALDIGDLDGDGIGDLVLGAPYHDTHGGDAGAVYVVPGPVLGQQTLDASTRLAGEQAQERAGSAVAWVDDMDGDGFAELIVGVERATGSHDDSGAVYVVAGPVTGGGDLADHVRLDGVSGNAFAGASVAAAGDVDGDGVADFLVGAPNSSASEASGGQAWLWLGPVTADADLDEADGGFRAVAASDEAGTSVSSAGDLNFDGYDDVAIGAPGHDAAGGNHGAVFVFYGQPGWGGASYRLDAADARLDGEGSESGTGTSLAPLGDLDGDNYDDLFVGAPDQGPTGGGWGVGQGYIAWGPHAGASSLSSATRLQGPQLGSEAGRAVAASTDVDGDGELDLLLGGPGYDVTGATDAGMAWLLYGPAAGLAATTALSSADATWTGGEDQARLGAVLATGDTNGDGRGDLLLAAPAGDSTTGDAGVVFLFDGHGM